MSENINNQRETYKLLEKISSLDYDSELALLTKLIQEIVNNPDFEIQGGRVWLLDSERKTYNLQFQYGNMARIPDGYEVDITNPEIEKQLEQLMKNRSLRDEEKDPILQSAGIIHYSTTGVGEIYRLFKGKYFQYLLGFNSKDDSISFNENLSVISSVATVALRNLSARKEKAKIQRDLKKASEIQRSLLPEHDLRYLDFTLYGACIPDSEVGGDYFDYIINTDRDEVERVSVVISDAASKGLPAAIQALFVSGALRMGLGFASRISHVFGMLNNLIYRTFPLERFVTLFYCELTRSKNRMILYANAGHCPAIVYRSQDDRFKELGSTGGLLGVSEHQKFGVENVVMRQGDIMLLFTDGIVEAQDENGNLFGEARLRELIRKYHKLKPKEIAHYIIEAVQIHSAKSSYTDDKTLVVIKRDEAGI